MKQNKKTLLVALLVMTKLSSLLAVDLTETAGFESTQGYVSGSVFSGAVSGGSYWGFGEILNQGTTIALSSIMPDPLDSGNHVVSTWASGSTSRALGAYDLNLIASDTRFAISGRIYPFDIKTGAMASIYLTNFTDGGGTQLLEFRPTEIRVRSDDLNASPITKSYAVVSTNYPVKWYDYEIDCDTEARTITVTLDGTNVGTYSVAMVNPINPLTIGLRNYITSPNGTRVYWDNLRAFIPEPPPTCTPTTETATFESEQGYVLNAPFAGVVSGGSYWGFGEVLSGGTQIALSSVATDPLDSNNQVVSTWASTSTARALGAYNLNLTASDTVFSIKGKIYPFDIKTGAMASVYLTNFADGGGTQLLEFRPAEIRVRSDNLQANPVVKSYAVIETNYPLKWYDYEIECNTVSKTITVYLDGVDKGTYNVAMVNPVNLTTIGLRNYIMAPNGSRVYWDDLASCVPIEPVITCQPTTETATFESGQGYVLNAPFAGVVSGGSYWGFGEVLSGGTQIALSSVVTDPLDSANQVVSTWASTSTARALGAYDLNLTASDTVFSVTGRIYPFDIRTGAMASVYLTNFASGGSTHLLEFRPTEIRVRSDNLNANPVVKSYAVVSTNYPVKWYDYEIKCDTAAKTITVYLDGVDKGTYSVALVDPINLSAIGLRNYIMAPNGTKVYWDDLGSCIPGGPATQLISTTPGDGVTNVDPDSPVVFTFAETLNPSIIPTVTVTGGVAPQSVTIAGATVTVTFAPGALAGSTSYTVSISGAKDVHGYSADASVSFTTAAVAFNAQLTVPADVQSAQGLHIAFNQTVNQSTLSTITVRRASSGSIVDHVVLNKTSASCDVVLSNAYLEPGGVAYTIDIGGVRNLSSQSPATGTFPFSSNPISIAEAMGFEKAAAWKSEADILDNPLNEHDILVTRKGGTYGALATGGLVSSTAQVKSGNFSGKWANHPMYPTISTRLIPQDWSAFSRTGFWVYSEKATGEDIFVLLQSDNSATSWNDYYASHFTIDFTGWQWIELPLAGFEKMGSPAGWGSIKKVLLSSRVNGRNPSPYSSLYLDAFSQWFQSGDTAASGLSNPAWSDNPAWDDHHDSSPFDFVNLNHSDPEVITQPSSGNALQHEIYEKDERAINGYFPRYNAAPVSVDKNGRKILKYGSILQSLDVSGHWVTADLMPAIQNYVTNTLQWSGFTLEDTNALNDYLVRFDADNHAYVTYTVKSGTGVRKGLLLYSPDNFGTWQVYALPYETARFERPDGHNDLYLRPPVILTANSGGGNIYLTIPTKNSNNTLTLPAPVLLAQGVISIAAQSGDANSMVTKGNKLYYVFGVTNATLAPPVPSPNPGESLTFNYNGTKYCKDGVPAFAVAYDFTNGQLSQPVFVGYGGCAIDGHNWPAITVDSGGYLHVMINGHHNPFYYVKSQSPLDITAWGAPALVGSHASYASLATDGDDTMYITYRDSLDGYTFDLSMLRKKKNQAWEPRTYLVKREKSFYSSLMNKMTIDPLSGKLFVAYVARSPLEDYGKDDYDAFAYCFPDLEKQMLEASGGLPPTGTQYLTGSPRRNMTTLSGEQRLLVSDDAGDSWRLATTADLAGP